MHKYAIIFVLLTVLSSCDYYFINPHEEHVGVIDPDDAISESSFSTCYKEKIFPFYYGRNPSVYIPGKDSLKTSIYEEIDSSLAYHGDNGYLTFRFIINCKGETGQFVIEELGMNFKTNKMNEEFVNHVFDIVKSLDQWRPISFEGFEYDSFIHLTFKITNGKIIEILP